LGFSRSAAATAAWLIASGSATTAHEAIAQVQAARPGVVINNAQRAALEQFAAARHSAR
jgi:protein-tyrosine phosphatase